MVARDTPDAAATSSTVVFAIPHAGDALVRAVEHPDAASSSSAAVRPAAQRPSSASRPMVSPGRSRTAFTASSTPGMNDVRS